MNREVLKEKCYTFIRHYCVEGTIDVWSGDMTDNPNNEKKFGMNLNSSHYYFRLNNTGKWISNYNNFKKNLNIDIIELHEYFTAEEIWNEYYINNKIKQ